MPERISPAVVQFDIDGVIKNHQEGMLLLLNFMAAKIGSDRRFNMESVKNYGPGWVGKIRTELFGEPPEVAKERGFEMYKIPAIYLTSPAFPYALEVVKTLDRLHQGGVIFATSRPTYESAAAAITWFGKRYERPVAEDRIYSNRLLGGHEMMIANPTLAGGEFKREVRQRSGAKRAYEDYGDHAKTIGATYARLIDKPFNRDDPELDSFTRIAAPIDPKDNPQLHMLAVLLYELQSMGIIPPDAPYLDSFWTRVQSPTGEGFLENLKEMLGEENLQIIEILDESFVKTQTIYSQEAVEGLTHDFGAISNYI